MNTNEIIKKINKKGKANKKEIIFLESQIINQIEFNDIYIKYEYNSFIIYFNNIPFAGILENSNYAKIKGFSFFSNVFSNTFWDFLNIKLIDSYSKQEKYINNSKKTTLNYQIDHLMVIGDKMARGMRARDTNKAINFQEKNKGKTAICKCPFHRNGGKGTEVPLENFNRHGEQGNAQAMCGEGKKIIENINHKFKRLTLYALTFPNDFKNLHEKISTIFKPLIINAQNQTINALHYQFYINNFNYENISTDGIPELEALNELEDLFLPKNIKLYDQGFSFEDGIKLVEELNNILRPVLYDLENHQNSFLSGRFQVLDSTTSKLYPVELMGANLSKKNWLYDMNGIKTKYRANVHNTVETGQRGANNRAKKWLSGGDHLKANQYMSKMGKNTENIHIDHIVPLSLGGVHDPSNLRRLDSALNIADKDKLTLERYNFLISNPHCLSKQHLNIFEKYKNDHRMLELQLKKSVRDYRNIIINLPREKKIIKLKSHFPGFNDSKIEDLCNRYFNNEE